ncbi:MAG: quinolinate synthase [Thermoplasmata archaeon M11B2D]|nr:MAG: quinolinate synthase [Thermoplasmata archaeon M11B2D]PNX53432.1 MAG: quinolinate synthase [Thermoplasmata archaeon M9B2D]
MQKSFQRKIQELQKKQHAVILAHNYQNPEIQDIADFIGDSLDLSLKAISTDASVIIFCGVDFMAESAKILNPEKTVILPDKTANCPMAGMVDTESLGWLKKEHPDAEVVAYINTTADVKALADICCTSANGVKIVKSRTAKKIIFVPDRNLGLYIQKQVPEKEMILWPGVCRTHHDIKKEDLLALQKEHPAAEILVHPECQPEIIDLADFVFSTNGMVTHAKESSKKEFIIGTEKGLCYRMEKEMPEKKFYPIPSAVCPNMKKTTLEKVLKSLETLEPTIHLPGEIMKKARLPLQRMMET